MSSENLATQYQQKTDKQHILDNPDISILTMFKGILAKTKITRRTATFNSLIINLTQFIISSKTLLTTGNDNRPFHRQGL